jgi:hypothetical protein
MVRGRGIHLENIHVQLQISPDHIATIQGLHTALQEHELEKVKTEHDLEIQEMKRKWMNEVVSGGPERLYAFILQEDKSRGMEIVSQMRQMEDRDKQHALDAIKVLIEGGELRAGELDGAVSTAVEGFRNILGQYAGTADKAKPELPASGDAGAEPS